MDFANIFFKKFALILSKHPKINIYIINLEKVKQLPNKSFYSLRLINFKTLKTHMKINLDNIFIYLFKFLISNLILFKKNQIKVFIFMLIIRFLIT